MVWGDPFGRDASDEAGAEPPAIVRQGTPSLRYRASIGRPPASPAWPSHRGVEPEVELPGFPLPVPDLVLLPVGREGTDELTVATGLLLATGITAMPTDVARVWLAANDEPDLARDLEGREGLVVASADEELAWEVLGTDPAQLDPAFADPAESIMALHRSRWRRRPLREGSEVVVGLVAIVALALLGALITSILHNLR